MHRAKARLVLCVHSRSVLLFPLKTILCIDEKQCVPFRSSRSLEPAGYIVFTVWDAKMARKVEELFAIDFVFNEEKGWSLPLEIVNQIAGFVSTHSRRIQQ